MKGRLSFRIDLMTTFWSVSFCKVSFCAFLINGEKECGECCFFSAQFCYGSENMKFRVTKQKGFIGFQSKNSLYTGCLQSTYLYMCLTTQLSICCT
jgi:hypothetical protein